MVKRSEFPIFSVIFQTRTSEEKEVSSVKEYAFSDKSIYLALVVHVDEHNLSALEIDLTAQTSLFFLVNVIVVVVHSMGKWTVVVLA